MGKSILFLCISFVICGTVRPSAYAVQNKHQHKETILDNFGFFVLGWELNLEDEEITFIVSVFTTGYVGLGISNNGEMAGSDMIIGGIRHGSLFPYFDDRHGIEDYAVPLLDKSQDWELIEFRANTTHTVLTIKRKFDTGDEDDVPIIPGVTKVIWAYGLTDDLLYHGTNRGISNIELIKI